MTRLSNLKGKVNVGFAGLWFMQDIEPQGWTPSFPSDFAGATGEQGIYLVSGHYSGEIEVSVEVFDEAPTSYPDGDLWTRTETLRAVYPSREASVFSEVPQPDSNPGLIQLPAATVALRVSAKGWVTPPLLNAPAESWLVQVWPEQE